MFKLHRKIEFALMALKHMSEKRQGELTSAKEVSDSYGGSFDTIARVMQVLAQKGVLHSAQGVNGGYLILKDLSKVSMYDLSLILLGPVKLVKCLSSSHCNLESNCNISTPMHVLNQHLINFYKNIYLKELLDGSSSFNAMKARHSSIKSRSNGDKNMSFLTQTNKGVSV